MRPAHACSRPPLRSMQRGIAALEFALLALFVMVPVLLGTFVFWEVLQTQQVVTRAAGDGARQVSRLLNVPRVPKANGSLPSEAEFLANATALARDTVRSTLRNHFGQSTAFDSRVTVALQPSGTAQWTLDVTYARPALLGRVAGLNFIEPETLAARSVIQTP